MKNVVVTLSSVLVMALASASASLAAQPSQISSAVTGLTESLARGVLQEPLSGAVAGVTSLPSTATAATDGIMLMIGAIAALAGAFVLIRKAVVDN
jgi:LPXTG-motif cell wall-anchored protein